MIDDIVDFLFPKRCAGCGAYGKDLCSKCLDGLEIADQVCPECGEESSMGWTHSGCKKEGQMDGLIVIYDFQDPKVKEIINEIKFGFNRRLVVEMLKNFVFETGVEFNYLVPVPLYFYRHNWRGFNQAEEIAEVTKKKLRGTKLNALVRVKNTKQQSMLSSREDREKNIKGAFEIDAVAKKRLVGKKVLLIDDVFTSGADMRECTKMLKKAGVSIVWGLALAH